MSVAPTTTDTSAPSTPAPLPAPVIPYGDPASGSTDAQLTSAQSASAALTAETQAQQITSASLSAYGSLPNPQVAFEAITTGATPTIASMIQAGNPLFQAELAGAPAGQQALTSPYPQVPSKINDPAQSLWAPPTAADQKASLGQSQNASWKSFGIAPEMNFAWMQQQAGAPPAQIRKWQNLLKTKGFLGDPKNPYQVSGVWDQTTEAAFQGFMIQWATPYALFSQNATTRGNANEFLSGLGIDAPTLSSSIGRDPSTLAQIAQGWMAAQGPDANQDQKSELQQYADQFGVQALPDSYQAILQTNLGQTVRDTMASLPFVESIPGVSGAYNAALNLVTGNVGDLQHALEDPRQARSQQISTQMTQQDKLSGADVANLNGALKDVQDDSGFLGFMSSYDNARTTTVLTVFDMFRDFATGHASKNMNPFDPLSSPRVEAQLANDNMFAGIFGAKAATDNPGWATFFNLAANMADDPTSYLPLIGEISAVEKVNGIRTVSRVIGGDAARAAFNDHIAEVGRMGINQGYFNAARTAYKQAGSRGLSDATRMFGLSGAGGSADVAKLRLVREMMGEQDDTKAWDLFQHGKQGDPNVDDMGFGYLANSGKGLYNSHSAWSALTQVKSAATLGKLRAVGGFNVARDWDALNDPIGTGQFFDNLAVVAGMKPEEIKPLNDAYMHAALDDPNNVMKSAKAVEDAVLQAYAKNHGVTLDGLAKWVGDAHAKVVSYAPDPVHGTETSNVLRANNTMDDATKAIQQRRLNEHQQDLKIAQSTGASPEDISMLQAKINEIGRPAPATTTQFGSEYSFPYSPFDMVVYKNPAFRKLVKLQQQSGIDKTMDVWRRITIGRISSAMRMDIGDDMIRPFSALIGQGHPVAAFQYLTQSIAKMVGLIVPGARGKILQNLNDFLEKNPEASRMLQTVGKTVQDTSTDIWDTVDAKGVGYHAGLKADILNHWSQDPISTAWLKGYDKGGETIAKIPKSTYYHGTARRMEGDAFQPKGMKGSDAGNLFGPGVYVTDNPAVADAYTAKGLSRPLSATERARGMTKEQVQAQASKTVYGMEPAHKLNLMDLGKPIPADLHQTFLNTWKGILGDDPAELSKIEEQLKTVPGDQMYQQLRTDLSGMEIPKYEADQVLQELHDALGAKGVHGFSYEGGKYTKSAAKHNASVIFDPASLKISQITGRDPVSLKGSDAAKSELAKFLKTSTDPKVKAWIQSRNMSLNPHLFDYQVDAAHDFMSTYFRNPTLRKMATTGHVNDKTLTKLIHDEGSNPAGALPIVKIRKSSAYAQNRVASMMSKGPEQVFEHFTGPMINTARSGGFMKIKGLYEQQIRKHFKDQPRYGTKQFEDSIERESTSRAIDWIQNNTYQGTRSVVGATLRNVFPFYGATANMDKFYMKQAMTTPFVGSAVMHTLAGVQASQSLAQQNVNPGMVGLQGVLAHLGFGAGEGLQINPLNAFFLTGDGIGSMVPGTGPIFAPLWTLASQIGNGNMAFAQILADVIPGAAQQIDYSTGGAKPQFSYLANLLTGASMAATGQNIIPSIPGLTQSNDTVNSKVSSAVQEWERANGRPLNPTDADYNSVMQGLRQQVGRDELLQGAAAFTLPVSPQVVNEQQLNTANALDTWRQQTTPAGKDQVILANLPGVTPEQWQAAITQTAGAPTVAQLVEKAGPNSDAALMAFDDSRVSESDRDAIAQAQPWVVSASTSKYTTANLGPNETERPFDLPQWQLMRSQGNITTLTPDQFVGTIANERDINTGWLEYDNLKDQEYQAMMQNGWTTNSPQYTIWNSAYFQPQLQSIGTNHPAWQKQFGSGGGTTAADLAGKTKALRTLQTWEVLPQHSDYENTQTILWRNALQLRDNAAGQLYALKQGGGSSAEQQLVMAAFQSQLSGLASQDPNFAAQLAGFRFSSWEDIVTLEADEMQANQYAGYPAQVGPQGTG